MLSKNKIKEISALSDKKERQQQQLFIAEGRKLIADLLYSSITVSSIYSTAENLSFFDTQKRNNAVVTEEVSEAEIRRISQLKTPQGCLAVCQIPAHTIPENAGFEDMVLCLDTIQDPGNFGTLLRMADWFGISDVFCSPGTADAFNPKVVQATMGAIGRIRIHYLPLYPFLQMKNEQHLPILGTYLDGENLYSSTLPQNGLLVFGNEGKGIQDELTSLMTQKITIPGFHKGIIKPESLNVSIAAAIVVSEFRRQQIKRL